MTKNDNSYSGLIQLYGYSVSVVDYQKIINAFNDKPGYKFPFNHNKANFVIYDEKEKIIKDIYHYQFLNEDDINRIILITIETSDLLLQEEIDNGGIEAFFDINKGLIDEEFHETLLNNLNPIDPLSFPRPMNIIITIEYLWSNIDYEGDVCYYVSGWILSNGEIINKKIKIS